MATLLTPQNIDFNDNARFEYDDKKKFGVQSSH